MTEKQKATLDGIVSRWGVSGKGTYVNRSNSKNIYALLEQGHVKLYPYTPEFGWVAFPAGACQEDEA